MTNLTAALGALVGALGSIAVAFGLIDNQTAGVLVSAAVTALGALFVIGNAIENLTKAKLAIANKSGTFGK